MKVLKRVLPYSRVRIWILHRLPLLYRGAIGRFGYASRPHFIVIGTQRGGTTSLLSYLNEHPYIPPPLRKEVHYFDLNYEKGLGWYYAHFPVKFACGDLCYPGEASPYYLYHPDVPAHVAKDEPNAKFVVLLRDPIARALSNYHHAKRYGFENRTFTEAIEEELDSLEKGELLDKLGTVEHRERSYIARGAYVEQLERWFEYFPREQFLIHLSEDLFQDPKAIVMQTLNFLDIDTSVYPDIEFKQLNKVEYSSEFSDELHQRMLTFFKPYNERLAQLLEIDLDHWK